MGQIQRSIWCALLIVLAQPVFARGGGDELDTLRDFVQRFDPTFEILSTDLVRDVDEVRTYRVTFNSLSWRTTADVDRTVWSHTLMVSIPETLKSHSVLFVISGGSNSLIDVGPGIMDLSDEMAAVTGTVVAELKMIPNQPLEFGGDGDRRKEDNLIAYSWMKFLTEGGDPEWVAQFPMTKASVMGMDAVAAVVKEVADVDVDGYVVAGASKRGWTSWLVAAVDPRVRGVIPIVIDVVNMIPSMTHHYESYGFWSDAIRDYESQGVTDLMHTPAMVDLAKLIDPIYHLEHLAMPKYILNGANDEFFLPDSSQFYLDQLQGPTYLRYVPNSGHLINNFDAFNSMLIFYDAVVHDKPLPSIDWERDGDWQLSFTVEGTPAEIILWEVEKATDRDFRLKSGEPWTQYEATTIPVRADGHYDLAIAPPAAGAWKGYFVEVRFEDGPMGYLKLSTDVRVAQR